MRRRGKIAVWIAVLICLGAILALYVSYQLTFNYFDVVERTEYRDPPPKDDLELTDDLLEDKNPAFKANLIDSRPLGDWELNASAAVIRLDCPTIKPEKDEGLLELNPSFAKAITKAKELQKTLLPSASLLDGAAKHFDDGLYAALDLACYRGELGFAASAPEIIESLFLALPEKSPARPFLAGALELAEKSQKLSAEEERQKAKYLADFENDKVRSKPISFYNWTPELQRVWKFYRYLQWDFDNPQKQEVPIALSAAVTQKDKLVPPYRSIYAFYARLTNPPLARLQPLVDFADSNENTIPASNKPQGTEFTRTIFPPSTSRETELFVRFFPKECPLRQI
jgi:hypothetical protein